MYVWNCLALYALHAATLERHWKRVENMQQRGLCLWQPPGAFQAEQELSAAGKATALEQFV